MTTAFDALNVPLTDAVLLNARRYGLTQENLTQFSKLTRSMRGEKTATTDSADQDVPQVSYSDLIKDYVKQRMTERMRTSMQADTRSQSAYSHNSQLSAQDFLLGGTGVQRQSSNDISSLLNMHFDLNTLQMLP